MDKRYEQYCLADSLFYDSPHVDRSRENFPLSERPLPPGWQRHHIGDWLVNVPPMPRIPQQGWKIHASACLDNAERVVTRVWDYCVPREISFKFVPSRLAVFMRNTKYAPRGSSGKVVTIYPADEAACELILTELGQTLAGETGPYILSDLRYGSGPLYVRYGGFTRRSCLDSRGTMVPAIENPAGVLVPDVRPTVFTVPSWVNLPPFLAPHLAERNRTTIEELPFRIERALHFSNGGGVYVGTDRQTGEQVVLKEGRPNAGLAADRSDAVTRLGREHDVLRRLTGLGVAPEARGYFEVGDHHFLAEEFIEGTPLNSCYADRFPLLDPDPDPAKITEYTAWALRICGAVERAVAAIHERETIINDLHMFNIMVHSDDTITLIDFEAATYVSEGRRPTVGNPGFAAPRDRTGFDIDSYSTACLRLAMFMPLTTLFTLDRTKAAQISEIIAGFFGVPPQFLAEAVHEITRQCAGPNGSRGTARRRVLAGQALAGQENGAAGEPTTAVSESAMAVSAAAHRSDYCLFGAGEQEWDLLKRALADAVLASATPSRADRAFPGDVEQFLVPGGGLGLAHGAAGVLYALCEATGERVPEIEEWLIARAASPARGTPLGLYDGLAGVGYVLGRLGHTDAALRAAGICLSDGWERLGSDLYGGLPGLALSLLFLGDSTGESGLLAAGRKAADIVAERAAGRTGDGERAPAGLLRGAAGQALLFIRLYERTGDASYLDAAASALAADLKRCVTDAKGSLQVDDGWRVLPYLNGGSTGIGIVLDRFLTHRSTAAFAEAAAKIRIAAHSTYYAQPGLFNGRSGLLLYLAGQHAAGPAASNPRVAAHVRRLAWHAVPYRGGLAFPGDMLLRLSMDLATGTAGVLLGLAAALSPLGAGLPFLSPSRAGSDELVPTGDSS
jgi:tRNA A-37 threonylcarbamoyl transferase component Bud32